jgi:hypothetical protein
MWRWTQYLRRLQWKGLWWHVTFLLVWIDTYTVWRTMSSRIRHWMYGYASVGFIRGSREKLDVVFSYWYRYRWRVDSLTHSFMCVCQNHPVTPQIIRSCCCCCCYWHCVTWGSCRSQDRDHCWRTYVDGVVGSCLVSSTQQSKQRRMALRPPSPPLPVRG